MQLDQIYINPHTQDLYAEIIALEDIKKAYGDKLITNQPNQGETNNEEK
tara:strand:- start:476 stop:622 length:147 start_codon:yes stop_codon:yes gene_type:complete